MLLEKLRVESYRKGTIFSLFFNIFAKILAFVSSAAIAYYFGASAETDVYFYAVFVATLLASFMAGLNSSVIIPEAMHIDEASGSKASERFLNFFIFSYVLIGLAGAALLMTRPAANFSLLSRFSPDLLSSHTLILGGASALLPLTLFCTLITDILTSRKFFTITMLAGMFNSVVLLAFLFMFHGRLHIGSAILGLVAAWTLQAVLLIYTMSSCLDWDFRNIGGLPESRVLKRVAYSQLGNTGGLIANMLPVYLLSGLGHGVISALNYGRQVSELPNLLFTNQVSSVLGIRLNELQAKSDAGGTARVFVETANKMLLVVIPISTAIFFLNQEFIELLFMRGAFDASSASLAGDFLKLLILLAPLTALNTALTRLLMAGRISWVFWYQIAFNLALIAFIWFGVSLRGAMGYPEALILASACNTISWIWLLRRIFPEVNYTAVLRHAGKTVVFSVAVYVPVAFLTAALFGSGPITVAITLPVYFLALLAGNLALRLDGEIADLTSSACRKCSGLPK